MPKGLGPGTAADTALAQPRGNARDGLDPNPVRNGTATGPAPPAAAGAAATIEAGTAPGRGAESAAPKRDPLKRDLPETKSVQEIAIEHPVTKTEARGRGRRGISKTRNVRTKAQTADRKSRGAQRSVKQGRYNWLYIHLISSFLWSCILWFSLQLFKGTPVSSSNTDTTRVDVQYIKVVITKSELNPVN